MPPQQYPPLLPNTRTVLTSLIDQIALLPPSPPSNSFEPSDVPAPPSNPLSSLDETGKNLLLTLHVLLPNETLPALDLLDRRCIHRLIPPSPAPPPTPPPPPTHPHPDPRPEPPTHPDALDRTSTTPTRPSEHPPRAAPPPGAAESSFTRAGSRIHAYYVQSASSSAYGSGGPGQRHAGRSRVVDREPARWYEVRLNAWNCSCPAFAFGGFPAGTQGGVEGDEVSGRQGGREGEDEEEKEGEWDLGGRKVEGGDGGGVDEGEDRDGEGRWRFGGLGSGEDAAVCKHLLACLLGEQCPIFRHCVQEREVSVEEAAGWAAGWGA
ncbi:MAG: hypothetical protein M1822_010144 [Bathelium mastoideum]|nr:MAG: hypothetical protein M1822_010144 [Bathelium mastoideum]